MPLGSSHQASLDKANFPFNLLDALKLALKGYQIE